MGRGNLLSFDGQMMSLILKNLIFACLNLLESQKISRKYLFRKECLHKLIRLSIKSIQGAMIDLTNFSFINDLVRLINFKSFFKST